MLTGQAEFLAGADDDQEDAGNRAGDADRHRPGERLQAIKPVEQDDADRHQAKEERGVAGGRALQSRDQADLEQAEADGGDAQHGPELAAGRSSPGAGKHQGDERYDAGDDHARQVVCFRRQMLHADFDNDRIETPDDGDNQEHKFDKTGVCSIHCVGRWSLTARLWCLGYFSLDQASTREISQLGGGAIGHSRCRV